MMKKANADHLWERGGMYYFRATINGKLHVQSLHTSDRKRAKSKARDMYEAATAGKWLDVVAVLRPAARTSALIGEVCRVYEDQAELMRRPSPQVVRYAVQALERIGAEAAGVDREQAPALGIAEALSEDAQDSYAAALLERAGDTDSTRISICSTLRTAKQIIKRDMVARLRRQLPGVPEEIIIDRWRRYRPIPTPKMPDKEFTAAEAATIRTAGDVLEGPQWLAWALGYYAALRAGEVSAARWGWLIEHEPTPQERVHAGWLAGRASVWLLRVEGTKTEGSTADVPLHDTVAALLLARRPEGAADDEFLLGPGLTARQDTIRELSAWFRAQGWEKKKTTHSLRAYRLQAWYNARGVEARMRWGRHAMQGMDRHYLASRYLGAEPLPADQ